MNFTSSSVTTASKSQASRIGSSSDTNDENSMGGAISQHTNTADENRPPVNVAEDADDSDPSDTDIRNPMRQHPHRGVLKRTCPNRTRRQTRKRTQNNRRDVHCLHRIVQQRNGHLAVGKTMTQPQTIIIYFSVPSSIGH